MEVSWNRGTPSHHPFLDGMFHETKQLLGYPPFMETSIYTIINTIVVMITIMIMIQYLFAVHVRW